MGLGFSYLTDLKSHVPFQVYIGYSKSVKPEILSNP